MDEVCVSAVDEVAVDHETGNLPAYSVDQLRVDPSEVPVREPRFVRSRWPRSTVQGFSATDTGVGNALERKLMRVMSRKPYADITFGREATGEPQAAERAANSPRSTGDGGPVAMDGESEADLPQRKVRKLGRYTASLVRDKTLFDHATIRQLAPAPQYGAAGVTRFEHALPAERSSRARSVPGPWPLLGGSGWPWLQLAVDLLMLGAAVAVATATGLVAEQSTEHARAALLYPLLAVGVMLLRGMYRRRHWRSVLDVLIAGIAAMSLVTMALGTAIAFAGFDYLSAPLVLNLWLFSVVFVCIGRSCLLLIQRWARRTGRIGERALVVGAGEIGSKVVRGLREHPEYGVVPVGTLEVRPAFADHDQQVPVVGLPEDMLEEARRAGAAHVIVTYSNVPDRELLTQVRRCQEAGIQVSLVPRFFESLNERVQLSHLGALPIVSLQRVDTTGWQFKLKYVLDRGVAALALIVLFPVLVLIAALVKLGSPGPVFFRQQRVGLDGHVFSLLKFRSMHIASDRAGHFVPKAGLAPGGVEGVDRRTRVGRLLRRTCLDELPQLINVLRGEMSLVGPRPERPEYVHLFGSQVKRYGDRHRTKSGITGWAQVNGLRGQTSLAERIEFDNQYIDNWSLGMDLKIMLRTVAAIFSKSE